MSFPTWMQRTEMLLGEQKLARLQATHVLVVGLGGVGGICAEMIARSGVGEMTIIDADIVEASNRNRQLAALISSNEQLKVEVMAARIRDINPDIKLNLINEFISPLNINAIFDAHQFDAVADCIDTLTPKVSLIRTALFRNIRIVSSMGAGGRIDPSMVRLEDISLSHKCKLAYYTRKKLHQYGIRTGFKVVYSPEVIDQRRVQLTPDGSTKKSIIGTLSVMPNIFGCYVAAEIIRGLIEPGE